MVKNYKISKLSMSPADSPKTLIIHFSFVRFVTSISSTDQQTGADDPHFLKVEGYISLSTVEDLGDWIIEDLSAYSTLWCSY